MDVSLEREAESRIAVKLQSERWEVNIRATSDELAKLGEIRTADWDKRHSIRAGESAGATVFWAVEGDNAVLLIGVDDETWDVALTLPLAVVDEIVTAARVI